MEDASQGYKICLPVPKIQAQQKWGEMHCMNGGMVQTQPLQDTLEMK